MKNNKTNVGSFATAKLQAKRHSLLAIIALAAVIGFFFASCDPDDLLGGKEVAVTGVTLSDTNLYLTIGGSVTLTATVTPADATDKAVVWATGDANVATVNNGKVTAVGAGITAIAVATVDGQKTAECTVTVTGSGSNLSLDGAWKVNTTDAIVIIAGSTGVITQWQTSNALWQSAKDKGYINIGDQWFRNLTKTGDLTWTGQGIAVTYNTSSPNVATGTTWQNCTITMNANGQTFQSTTSTGTATYTRVNTYSLDGVWENGNSSTGTGYIITISGSTGVYTQIRDLSAQPLWQSAKDKGYIKVGDQTYRNLTKTGDLTWTGQSLGITYNTSSPNVATGTGWANLTITMNANGQTFQAVTSGTSTNTATYTRQ